MISLVKRFPFFIFTKEPFGFETVIYNDNKLTNNQKVLIKNCRKILNENHVPLNKVRFVLEQQFIYDIDNDIVNPPYKMLLPRNKKMPIIEIGKPVNTITVFLGKYHTTNNFITLKQTLKGLKRGIVILASGEDYNEVIYAANLDEATIFYKKQCNEIDYNS